MDNTLKKLLALVEKGSVEQRCAAMLTLGALKLDNAQIVKTVAAALVHANPLLKDFAVRYFEEARPKAGVLSLLDLLDDSDKDIQERAVRLLSEAGQAAVEPLLKRAPNASRVWQLNAARVLCAARGKSALRGLLGLLTSGSDEFNKTVCDLMVPAVRAMQAKEQDQFYKETEVWAGKLNTKERRPAVVSAIRLLGLLGRPQARRWLFGFVAADHPPILRSHALVALLRCLRDQDLRKDEYGKLFPLLEEAEFSEVARLALDLLDAHPLPEDSRPVLVRLLESPHGGVQKFALRKMGDFGTPATVRTLVEQLGDPDYRRRDIAAVSLHKIPEARGALIKELIACDNPSKASTIAEVLPSYEGKWRRDTLEALWKRLHAAIAAEDRIRTAFFHALKNADPEFAYDKLATEGARLVKAKKYNEALPFLVPLKEFSEFKSEDKFRLALAQLKLRAHKNAAVEQLIDLFRNSAFPLFETLKKEKKLAAEDLFDLGFKLAERSGEERGLGKNLLELVAGRFPRHKIGKNAKNKLKLLGG